MTFIYRFFTTFLVSLLLAELIVGIVQILLPLLVVVSTLAISILGYAALPIAPIYVLYWSRCHDL